MAIIATALVALAIPPVAGASTTALSWHGVARVAPAGLSYTYSNVSCTSTKCFTGTSNGIYVTTDNATWSLVTGTASTKGTAYTWLACVSDSNCYAATANKIYESNDGGATFGASLNLPVVKGTFLSVNTCTADRCWFGVTSGKYVTTLYVSTVGFDGRLGTPTTESLPTGMTRLFDVECSTSLRCVAVGSTPMDKNFNATPVVGLTSDGGATWTATRPYGAKASGMIRSLACYATTCMYLGFVYGNSFTADSYYVSVSHDSGATWTRTNALPGTMSFKSLVCVSTTTCAYDASTMSTDSAVVTTDGGSTWTTQLTLNPNGFFSGDLSCGSAANCFISDFDSTGVTIAIKHSSDFFATASATHFPLSTSFITGVSCASSTYCAVLGFGPETVALGQYWQSSNGAQSWNLSSAGSDSVGYFEAVSCSSATHCVVASVSGTDGSLSMRTTTDGGTTWSTSAVGLSAGSQTSIYNLQCVSSLVCVAAGVTSPANALSSTPLLLRTSDGGATWSQLTIPAHLSDINGVQCVSDTHCLIAGDTTINGTTNASNFVTVDGTNYLATAATFTGGGTFTSLTCSGATLCFAQLQRSGSRYTLMRSTDFGDTWKSAAIGLATGTNVQALSCPTQTQCVGLASVAKSMALVQSTNGGGKWTSTKLSLGSSATNTYAAYISCPTATWCLAATSDGTMGVIKR